MVSSQEKSAYKLTFWSHLCGNWTQDFELSDLLSADEIDRYDRDGFVVVPDERDLTIFLNGTPDRTECETSVIMKEGLYVEAILRHTDTRVATYQRIPWDRLIQG